MPKPSPSKRPKHPNTKRTHQQAFQRRFAIASEINAGADPTEVASKHQISISLVKLACAEHRVPVPTRPASAVRKDAIAAAVARGDPIEAVCTRYRASAAVVRAACIERGVDPPRVEQRLSVSTYEIIGALCAGAETYEQIGARYGLTRQRVSQINQECVRAGIPVPARKDQL